MAVPSAIKITSSSNQIGIHLFHDPSRKCYGQCVFTFHVTWIPIATFNITLLKNTTISKFSKLFYSTTILLTELISNTEYCVKITAHCIGNNDAFSDPLVLNVSTHAQKEIKNKTEVKKGIIYKVFKLVYIIYILY